jgi:GNAT superfamily N-acetyltransferase
LAQLVDLVHRRDGYPAYSFDDFTDFLVSRHALAAWVAAANSEIVGHVALHTRSAPEVMRIGRQVSGLGDEELAVVARLIVAPAARHQGVGRALLETATAQAREVGRRPILDVHATLISAISLYESVGWLLAGSTEISLPNGRLLPERVYVSPMGQPTTSP